MKNKGLLIMLGSVVLVLVMAALPFMSACAKPAPAPAPEPIKIGILVPFSGPYTIWGQWALQGVELRLDEANWQVAGRPVETIVEDEGPGEPSIGVDKARKLVEADKVRIVMGPVHGAVRFAALEYTASQRVMNFAFPPPERFYLDVDWSYGVGAVADEIGYHLALYAYDEMGIKTVTAMGPDFITGHYMVDEGLGRGLKERGGTIIQNTWTPFPCSDFSPYLAALKPADAFATFMPGPPNILPLLTQYHELGLFEKMPFLNIDAMDLTDELLAELGDFVLGMKAGSFYQHSIDNPENRKFVSAFKDKYGTLPNMWSASPYEGMSAILAMLEATGGDDTDPEKLNQALLGLKMELPGGPVLFEAVGTHSAMARRPVYIVEVVKVDGAKTLKIIHTYPPGG